MTRGKGWNIIAQAVRKTLNQLSQSFVDLPADWPLAVNEA